MSKVGLIICGVDDWERDIIPAIKSILNYEPNVPIVTVTKKEPPDSFYEIDNKNVYSIWGELNGYAQAINLGIRYFLDPNWNGYVDTGFDWLLVMNGDVICIEPFVNNVLSLNAKTIYGNKLHKAPKFDMPIDWIDGWIYALPVSLLEDGLRFDEKFLIAGFEDADFCLRAFFKFGYGIGKTNLPFNHLAKKVRRKSRDYNMVRNKNLTYLKEKHSDKL